MSRANAAASRATLTHVRVAVQRSVRLVPDYGSARPRFTLINWEQRAIRPDLEARIRRAVSDVPAFDAAEPDG